MTEIQSPQPAPEHDTDDEQRWPNAVTPAPVAAHTPGPLEAIGHIVRTARNEDGSGGYLVAECSVLQPCREGDARLFAAAQDLLEAAQAADCSCSVFERASGHCTGCWMPGLLAAIAKATGAEA